MIFATLIEPLLDQIVVLLATGLEVIKGKWSVKIADYNNQITTIESDEIQEKKILGFIAEEEDDDYED